MGHYLVTGKEANGKPFEMFVQLESEEEMKMLKDNLGSILSAFDGCIENIHETKIAITGYYYRESDRTSYVAYLDRHNKQHLTNGVCDWTTGVADKIKSLQQNEKRFNFKKLLGYMKNCMPYSDIYQFLKEKEVAV